MKELTLNTTVYLVTGYSDLRKGIEGLAAVVQGSLSLDPFNKGLYLFCGRRRDRIKGLIWEGDGFLLLYKRLDSGVFRWPRNELNGYRDSEAQIEKCNTAIKDRNYNIALTLYNDGQYTEAISIFQALNGYKDSEALIVKCKADTLKNPKVGDTIYWGTYEQDNDTSNGKEDIEWLVLAIDGNKALVISKYALDCQEYNAYRADITWKKCSLRTWMNGPFLNNAFSADEQAKILSAAVLADENPKYSTDPGNATTDKMFLLSITEAEKYFTTDASRKCTPTAYAKAQGAYPSTDGNSWWWLRSPGLNQRSAAVVYHDGSILYGGASVKLDFDDIFVRPAMWIDLDA